MDELPDGLYESIVNRRMEEKLRNLGNSRSKKVTLKDVDFAMSYDLLSNYIRDAVRESLKSIHSEGSSPKDPGSIPDEIDICNRVLDVLSSSTDNSSDSRIVNDSDNFLMNIGSEDMRPTTSLSISSMFTGSATSIPLFQELKREIASSDEIFLLVSFIKMSGLNLIRKELKDFTERGGKLRVLTTTYMQATEQEALDAIGRMNNTEIKVSYNTRTTRMHAKSYVFKRKTGFDTAFIGSSNLSSAALNDGMEWNVKLTSKDVPQILKKVAMIFDEYWNSVDFESYDPNNEEDRAKLASALSTDSGSSTPGIILFDWHPYPFQSQILAELETEREIYGRYRNLVVAATGTGKTALAAFDYRRFCADSRKRLLFIAHREEILRRSMDTFRSVLRDPNFGNLYTGNSKPAKMDALFMSVQTLRSLDENSLPPRDYFDYIVVDEAHHISADSYARTFGYFTPRILLGLTATPERMDGKDILQYFDNHIASEIRLTEAINRELLVPFHYFGITDTADISNVRFVNGAMDKHQLGEIYTDNRLRAQLIVDKVREYKPIVSKIKGLGFCATVEHAEFMTDFFNGSGYRSVCVTSKTDTRSRNEAISRLERGDIQFIFTVDLYNEGVDIPSVNLELMLRPTESLTIFIQQLGRGLRTSFGKQELTVLDFVGHTDKKYKVYQRKLNYMSSLSRQPLREKISEGFTGMPIGCSIQLEEKAKDYVLATIDSSIGKKHVIEELRSMINESGSVPTLQEYIRYREIEPIDVYRFDMTYDTICRLAKNEGVINEEADKTIAKGFRKLALIDSISWIKDIQDMMATDMHIEDDDRSALMLFYSFFNDSSVKTKRLFSDGHYETLNEFVDDLRRSEYADELMELMRIRNDSIRFIERKPESEICSLMMNCTYFKEQILAGIGMNTFVRKYPSREGVLHIESKDTDVFFITLNKSDKDFSSTTMYQDYAINDRLFHWESQSGTTPESTTGKRYMSGRNSPLFFVREYKQIKGIAAPFTFIGEGKFISSEGSKPMQVTWEMNNTIPMEIQRYSANI